MDMSQNGMAAAVASCLRNGGTAFGLDAERWADVILAGGEPEDLYNVIAALIDPNSAQADAERQRLYGEIASVAEAAA